MPKSYFAPLPTDLPAAELLARRQRQRHAEWGLTVAVLSGTPASPDVIAALQSYIDGAVPIEDLAHVEPSEDALPSPAYLATLTRHRLAQGETTAR